jgi:hypothetical protein
MKTPRTIASKGWGVTPLDVRRRDRGGGVSLSRDLKHLAREAMAR